MGDRGTQELRFASCILVDRKEKPMSIKSKITDLLKGTETHSGDTRKKAGAGPALAAHSKDAKSKEASGQNKKAAKK
jgi:hypothetical protein